MTLGSREGKRRKTWAWRGDWPNRRFYERAATIGGMTLQDLPYGAWMLLKNPGFVVALMPI
jgi:hypothetical protein